MTGLGGIDRRQAAGERVEARVQGACLHQPVRAPTRPVPGTEKKAAGVVDLELDRG